MLEFVKVPEIDRMSGGGERRGRAQTCSIPEVMASKQNKNGKWGCLSISVEAG